MFEGDICNNSGVLNIILLIKNIIMIVQIAVPILLIVLSMWDIIRLVISSSVDFKKAFKKITGRLIAAVIVFMVPYILNMVLSFLTETKVLQETECWTKATAENIEQLKKEEQANTSAEGEALSNKNYAAKKAEALRIRTSISFSSSTAEGGAASTEGIISAVDGTCVTPKGPYNNVGAAIISEAKQYLGNPYVYGGTDLVNGTDCSGFTMGIYSKFGSQLPRVSDSQALVGQNIGLDLSKAKEGDLLVFPGHVGIYMGNGQMIHASSPQTGIIVGSVNSRTIIAIRRIICT